MVEEAQRVALITGANTGIGLETARGMAERGFEVVLAARDKAKGEAALADIRSTVKDARLGLLELDLSSLDSVRRAATAFLEAHRRLDVLINNAGLILGDRRETEDGFESTFGINHLGHFLLTNLLLERLKASAPSRVVNVASDAHRVSKGLDFEDLMRVRRTYAGMPVYGDSKLANILFTRELARRLEGTGVVAHAVHPGVVRTRFAADGDVEGLFATLVKIAGPFMLTPAKGAQTSIHVATSEQAGACTGLYWAKSRKKAPTKYAQDDDAARRLWEVSAELVKLPAGV